MPIGLTRSHKYNDRDHAGLADGTAPPQEHLPRYFAKHGHLGVNPKKVKKNGSGRSNWGNAGEEVIDEDFSFTKARRRTNSSGFADNIAAFKTKFDPVFEESVHGPAEDDGEDLTKTESSESGRSSAYGDDKVIKH
ncbi:STF2-like protein [Colletotrichum tofieldiae]|nr:STF2-like protein [Colletotrichum tofieldiae]